MSKYRAYYAIIISLAVIIFYLFFNYNQNLDQQLTNTKNELAGLQKLKVLDSLNNALQLYRGLNNLKINQYSNNETINTRLLQLQKQISPLIDDLNDPKLINDWLVLSNRKDNNTSLLFAGVSMIIESLNVQTRNIADIHQLL